MTTFTFEFKDLYDVKVTIKSVSYIDHGYGDCGYEIDYTIDYVYAGNDDGDIVSLDVNSNYVEAFDEATNEELDELIGVKAIELTQRGQL